MNAAELLGKVSLLIVPASPLNAPGLLTARGWDALRGADSIAVSCAHPAWRAHVREAGIDAVVLNAENAAILIEALEKWFRQATSQRHVNAKEAGTTLVWLADSEHPFLPSPVETVKELETALGRRIDVDFVFASPVAPGSAVVESVRIMHELRSPGGDRWSAEQTHASLSRYLLEETHEVLEELDRGGPDTSALVSEFGDLLFQLVFHARIGTESADPWDLDSVARALNAKMYRRNPHIFSPGRADISVEDAIEQWEEIKAHERSRAPERALDEGIPAALPALQRAFKIAQRAATRGELAEFSAAIAGDPDPLARQIGALVLRAAAEDTDPESSLRGLLARIKAASCPKG